MNYQIEKPIHNHYNSTSRSLDMNSPENSHLKNEKVVDEIKKLLDEVKVRFDTDPKCYLRNDFRKLVQLLQALVNKSYDPITDVDELPNPEENFDKIVRYNGKLYAASKEGSDYVWKELGSGGGGGAQSDWNEENPDSPAYILNKPEEQILVIESTGGTSTYHLYGTVEFEPIEYYVEDQILYIPDTIENGIWPTSREVVDNILNL